MKTADSPVYGAHCYLVWDEGNSTISISVTPEQSVSAASSSFGALAYAIPYGENDVVSTTLHSNGGALVVEAATQIATMLSSCLRLPVYVNTPVESVDVMLLKSIKSFVEGSIRG